MPEFLVEAYFSSYGAPSDGPPVEDIAEAANALTREGHDVSLASVLVIPEDETCLYLFEAGSADAVLEVAARAGLRFEGQVEEISTRTFPRAEPFLGIRSEPASATGDAGGGEPSLETGRFATGA